MVILKKAPIWNIGAYVVGWGPHPVPRGALQPASPEKILWRRSRWIYTNSFTKLDVEKLASAITSKLGIVTKAVHDRNNQYMLTISRTQLEKVRELIGPHMHPSMSYKLGLSSCNKNFDYNNITDESKFE